MISAGIAPQRSPLVLRRQTVVTLLVAAGFFAPIGATWKIPGATGMIWQLITLITGIWYIRHQRLALRLVVRFWPLFILPALAFSSVLWSRAPSVTMWYSVQLIISVLFCLMIGTILSTRQIMVALALAGLGCVAASYLNTVVGFLPPAYEDGFFLGIFSQKNNFGLALFFTAFSISALSVQIRQRWIGLLTILALFPTALATQSVTGQVGFIFALLLLVVSFNRALPPMFRMAIPLILVSVVALLVGIYVVTGGQSDH